MIGAKVKGIGFSALLLSKLPFGIYYHLMGVESPGARCSVGL